MYAVYSIYIVSKPELPPKIVLDIGTHLPCDIDKGSKIPNIHPCLWFDMWECSTGRGLCAMCSEQCNAWHHNCTGLYRTNIDTGVPTNVLGNLLVLVLNCALLY